VLNSRPRYGEAQGFTIVELMVVLVIFAIGLVLGAVALGGIAGAKTREGAGKLATAVRYTYNLAAINNKTYALYLNLDENSYYAGPLKTDNECDRVLLALDGKDSGAVLIRFSNVGDEEDDDEDGGLFGAVAGGANAGATETGPPAWAGDEGSKSNKLMKMLAQETRAEARVQSRMVGVELSDDEDVASERKKKRLKTYQRNLLGKPQKLPKKVRFVGVMVREGEEPVTKGVVPLIFFPHGYTQRALIYIDGGDEESPEEFTVEIMTLQGRGVVHAERLDKSAFEEVMD
jgi:general secretion pathway protein H